MLFYHKHSRPQKPFIAKNFHCSGALFKNISNYKNIPYKYIYLSLHEKFSLFYNNLQALPIIAHSSALCGCNICVNKVPIVCQQGPEPLWHSEGHGL